VESLANPGGESVLAWLSLERLGLLQIVVNGFVTLGIARVCWRFAGPVAAWLGVLMWSSWPSVHNAVHSPYYYYWPNVCATAVALAWVERHEWVTGPLLALWVQLRATAVGPLGVVTLRSWRHGAVAVAILLATASSVRTQVWHDLYIGIGTRPNPYGVVYSDEHAIAVAAAAGIEFKAPGYEPFLRGRYLKIALADPLLIARNFALNTLYALGGGSLAGPTRLLCVVPIIVLLNLRRESAYRGLAAVWAAQCATLGFVCRPQEGYMWETMALVCILGVSGGVRAIRLIGEALYDMFDDSPRASHFQSTATHGPQVESSPSRPGRHARTRVPNAGPLVCGTMKKPA